MNKTKSRQNGNRQRNNAIESKQISFERLCYNMKTLYNAFILKCVSITNISI